MDGWIDRTGQDRTDRQTDRQTDRSMEDGEIIPKELHQRDTSTDQDIYFFMRKQLHP